MREPVRLGHPAPSPEMRRKGGVPTLALGNGVTLAVRLLLSIVVAQVLGPAGRGAVALISATDEVSTALFTAGIPIATGYHPNDELRPDAEAPGAAANVR